ncbi:MAG: tetratricopeptide repeat protein [Nitrospirae bacterium]|nr:tetratricopeptide repeat protein [Nitrospirota bacterium]
MTGMLFGLHPLHVETAVWLSARPDLMCALFFLLSMLAYTNYADRQEQGTAAKGSVRRVFNVQYVLSLAFFVLALASKPMAVSLPAVLLILDWYPFRRMNSRKRLVDMFMEKIPFMAVGFLVAIVTIAAHERKGAIGSLITVPLEARLLIAAKSVLSYLWKMALPFDLLPFYPYPARIPTLSGEYLLSVVLVCVITAACIRMMKKERMFMAAWFFYLVTLLPISGVITVRMATMADRYTYIPSLAPFLLLGVGSAGLWARVESARRWSAMGRHAVVGTALLFGIVMIFLTVHQTAIWRNSITLWSYVIEKAPDRVPTAYINRGMALKEIGQIEGAIADYTTAIALWPDNSEIFMKRGWAFKETGQIEQAINDYTEAIRLNPSDGDAYIIRGLLLVYSGHPDRGVNDFDRAISLKPANGDAYLNRGVAYERMGDLQRAIKDYDMAISLNPSDFLGYRNRGVAFREAGQVSMALADFNRAVLLNPDSSEIYLSRGDLYRNEGSVDRAIKDYRRACDLGSNEACDALGSLVGTHKMEGAKTGTGSDVVK